MLYTPLAEIKSKNKCLVCRAKRLTTNGTPKAEAVVHYHCEDCGYEYPQNEKQREYYERMEKNPGNDQPWSMGFLILALMVATLLLINADERGERNGDPTSQLEIPAPLAGHLAGRLAGRLADRCDVSV